MKLNPVASNQTELELPSGITVFFSYKTPVACHIPGEGYAKTDKQWSRTTSKHIGQFLSRNGFSGNMDRLTVKPQSFFDNLTA